MRITNVKQLLQFFNDIKHNYLELLKELENCGDPVKVNTLARQINIEIETFETKLNKAIGKLNLSWIDE